MPATAIQGAWFPDNLPPTWTVLIPVVEYSKHSDQLFHLSAWSLCMAVGVSHGSSN